MLGSVVSGLCLCFFADDIVLLASSNMDLQLTLGQFAAVCEVRGMKIGTPKSQTMVLSPKRVIAQSGLGKSCVPSGGVQVSQNVVYE